MAEIPLAWRFGIRGGRETAGEIRTIEQAFRDLEARYKTGKITLKEFRDEHRLLTQHVRALNSANRAQRASFEAMHPRLTQLGRTMSVVSGITNKFMTAMNAINIAQIAFTGTTTAAAQAEAERNQRFREWSDAVAKFGPNSKEAADAADALRIADQNLKDQLKQDQTQQITNVLTLATTIAFLGSSIVSMLKNIPEFKQQWRDITDLLGGGKGKMAAALAGGAALAGVGALALATGGLEAFTDQNANMEKKLKAVGGVLAIGAGMTVMLSQLGGHIALVAAIATAIAVAVTAIIVFRKELADFFTWLGENVDDAFNGFFKWLNEDIPKAFSDLGRDITNWYNDNIKPVFETDMVASVSGFIDWTMQGGKIWWQQGWDGLEAIVKDWKTHIIDKLTELRDEAIKVLQEIWDRITGIPGAIAGAVTGTKGTTTIATPTTGGTKTATKKLNIIEAGNTAPVVKAAGGFGGIVNRPTLFLAGEAGAESVNITPRASGGPTAASTIIINIHGSVITERELYTNIDRYFKTELKRRGF